MPEPLGPGDEDELAALDDEVHPAQDGRARPVGLVDVLEDEDGPLRGLAREARAGAQQGPEGRLLPGGARRRGSRHTSAGISRRADRQVFGSPRAFRDVPERRPTPRARRARGRARRRGPSASAPGSPVERVERAPRPARRAAPSRERDDRGRPPSRARAHEAVGEQIAVVARRDRVRQLMARRRRQRRDRRTRADRAGRGGERDVRARLGPLGAAERRGSAAEVRGEVEVVDAEVQEHAAVVRGRRVDSGGPRAGGRASAPRPAAPARERADDGVEPLRVPDEEARPAHARRRDERLGLGRGARTAASRRARGAPRERARPRWPRAPRWASRRRRAPRARSPRPRRARQGTP